VLNDHYIQDINIQRLIKQKDKYKK